ncbi:non-homologous end-joining DNA ligase LigD [Tessaracoccus lubricantis]|uniref:non-homologous end-joining DNA ligase LigD n=1 Tax=Tessaracoccus lubricantis TaxID=545543 RepID=UPI0031EE178F
MDLDPQPGRDFGDAITAALALRDVMAEAGLKAYAKTSGNRGIHVYARIKPTHEFQDVRHGVIGIARELERRMPELVTSAWWKEERGERVFVDFNQANRDRTIAAAYSPRPLPGAPVSTPLSWEELREATPSDFTIGTVPELLQQRECPWADIDAEPGQVARPTSSRHWGTGCSPPQRNMKPPRPTTRRSPRGSDVASCTGSGLRREDGRRTRCTRPSGW